MKRALGKMKRTISVLLAAAMIITALPQTSALAYASEVQDVLNEGDEAAKIVGEDKENNDTGNSSADADGNTDSGKAETEAPDQTGAEVADAVDQTDEQEKENSDETGSGETEVTDQTDPDGTDDSEEDPDQTVSDEALAGDDTGAEETEKPETAEDAGQPKNGNLISVLGAEEGETVSVRLNVPRYEDDRYSFLTQVWYAVGEDGEFQRTEEQPGRYGVNKIDIPAKAGEKLRVKLVLRDRVRIEEVSYSGMEEGAQATTITPEEGEEHIYAIDTIPSGSGTDPVYQINIKADYHYSLHFVDVYASKNPDAENNKSVAFYQYAKDAADGDSAAGKDLIGETLELSGQEMQEFFSEEKYNYALEVQEGYTFYSIDANSSTMRVLKDKSSSYENGYILSGAYDLGAEDITVFVLAEPTKENRLTFNVPEELKDKVDITVTYTDPESDPISGSLEPEDNGISIKNDRRVWFDVTVKDPDYTVRATCEENGGDAVALPHYSREEYGSGQGWKSRFYLEDAEISMKDGDVKVNLEQIAMYPVTFQLNPEEIDGIDVYAPTKTTFRYSDYSGTRSCTAWVAEGEKLRFTVDLALGGTLIASTSEDGSGELHAVDDYYEECDYCNAYIVAPTEPMSVYLTMKGYQYQLDYDVSDFDVKVCDNNGNPIELSADNKFAYTGDTELPTFRIMVKINSGKWTAASVTYEDELDGRIEAKRVKTYDDEENGYLCYVAEEAGSKSHGANVIAVQGAHTITFAGNKEAESTGIQLRRYDRHEWDSWTDWNYLSDIELTRNNKFEVKGGENVYFTLEYFQGTTYSLNLSLSGSGGQLKVYEDEDWVSDENGTLYYFTAEEDATITAELTERKQHTVTVNSGDSVTDFKVSGSSERPDGETENTGKYLVRDGNSVIISGITGGESATGCRGKVVCTVGDKSYEVPMKYGIVIDGRWESGAYFELEVTEDMAVTVDLVQTTQPVITFAGADQITSVKIWEASKEPEEENLYNSETGEAVLSDDKEYRLDFQLKDGLAAKSVIWKDKLSGEERVLELGEDEYRIYELGVPQGDAEITIETVQGYTVQFDIPAVEDIIFEETITEYQHEITKDSVQVIATESFPFRMWEGEGRYRLSVDSDTFTLEKVLKQPEDGGYDDQYYQYVLKPVTGATIPAVVKIQAEEYAKHTVTLDYPTEIKTIYLLDDNGDACSISNKQAEVQGVNTVLGVKAIRGYEAKVSVQGSGESKELTPFRLAEGDVSEYYLGELAEDVAVTVTAERSTQKLTYYKVGFYSPGNGARIRDAGTNTLYSVNEYYEDYQEFEYPYSILKGSSISFTVDPRDGYEVDAVYANGEVVKPVQNVVSQKITYTVVPVEDTLITVKVSQIAEKYPITFTYPAAVQSVTVKGYELTDKKLEVKTGTKLEFTVELADTKHSITSVTMNGKEAAFNKDSGCYSITSVAAPMEVVITTVENIDKKVTFKNMVTNMLYSVETSGQVTESGTDTYTVAALASVLRFTVTSTKKESVPAVSYVNAAGSQTVVQAKTNQEIGSMIAYTYEIAVSQLAAESEIVIGETTVAGEEDKAKLDACIKKYKDQYNQEEYTAESWEAYTKALKAAEDCMKKVDAGNATKAEVEAAIADLEKAVKGLTKIGEEPTPDTKEGLWFEILENEETSDGSYVYTGAAIKPDIKVYNGDTLLEVKKDYTVAYKQNTNAGTATITVTGKGNFKSKATATFTINKKDISDGDISAADVYAIMKANGTVANPKVAVKFGKKTLKPNNDYKVIWPEDSEIKDTDGKAKAGVYNVTISTTAVKKVSGTDVDSTNYKGSRTIAYTVLANDAKLMSKATITLTAKNVDYADRNDPAKRPQVKTVKISGKEVPLKEFIITDTGYEQAGKATITVTGKDQAKYYGSKSVTYDVKGTKLSASGFAIGKIDSQDYTGAPIYINQEAEEASMRKLEVKPKNGAAALTEGTDYTVSYATGKKVGEHTNVGTVTVTITGMGAYTGSMKTTFKITPVDLGTIGSNQKLVFEASGAAKYTKTGAKPEITTLTFNGAELVEKKDYTISYQKNSKVTNGATATMTIKGKGNFKGKHVHEYAVTGASKDDVYATATDIVKPAKINQVKSTVKVFEASTGKVLKAGTDYEKAIKYYSDEACTKEITADNFDKPIAENSAQTPTDFDAEIYAKIIMKGNYAGTAETPGFVTTKFRVYNKDLKMTSKKLVITVDTTHDKNGKDIVCDGTKSKNPYYTGAYIEPKVTVTVKGSDPLVTLVEGEDYEVKYANHKNRGKATITVTGIGNGYGGTKSVKFTIVAKDMKWAEQTVKRAAEVLSGLVPVTE